MNETDKIVFDKLFGLIKEHEKESDKTINVTLLSCIGQYRLLECKAIA